LWLSVSRSRQATLRPSHEPTHLRRAMRIRFWEASTSNSTDTREKGMSSPKQLVAKLFAEGRANEELRRRDPEAYMRKMEAELPENHCCLCRARVPT
jgi:hypothetical protein